MAIALTTSYKLLGKVTLTSSYTTEFRLYAKIGTQDITNNKTPVTTKITFYRSTGTYSFGSATGKITGSITGTRKYTTTTTMNKGETTVLETTKDITHNSDGTCTINLGASWVDSYNNKTTKTISTVQCTLPTIPRASGLIPANTYVSFGSSVKIDIDRKVDTYTDTITWVGYTPIDNGDGSYNMYGTPSDTIRGTIVEKTDAKYVDWQIPNELSTLIPTLRVVGVKLTCTTYNGDTVVGTTEKWLFVRTIEENSKPLINNSFVETNDKIIEQLGTNDFSIPVLNVSRPKFTFEATPRFNATIKSLTITCDDGQTSNISPHVFSQIGGAKFTITAIDSRDYPTTIEIDLTASAIPYIKPNIKELNPIRESPISGEIILSANGIWYGGTMINDIANPLNVSYKCKIKESEEEALLIDIPNSAITFDEENNEWEITNYSLGTITEYNKNYNFTLYISDYYNELQLSKVIRKGISTFDAGEHDLKVNGDLYVADEDGLNKVNVLEKIKNLESGDIDLTDYAKKEELQAYTKTQDLSTVALTGRYYDLLDEPISMTNSEIENLINSVVI